MKNGKGSEITRKQKELLKLQRELNVIRKKIHALPLLPLPKPVFHSYAIGWELKLTTSKYIDQYKYIVNVYAIHSKTKTLKKAKELNPPKISLSNREYLKLLEKYPMALRWFIKGKNKLNKKIYIFNKQDILIKRIFKIYATHLRTIDPNLESRKSEIEKIIYENYKNSSMLNKYLGIKVYWREDVRHKYEIRYLETITKEEVNGHK